MTPVSPRNDFYCMVRCNILPTVTVNGLAVFVLLYIKAGKTGNCLIIT